jgi:hypothetical protein
MAKKSGFTRATLADIAREMAKPRLTVSVREDAEIAEEKDTRVRRLPAPPGKERGLTPNQFQAGTIMVHHSAIFESLELESEPFRRNWRLAGDHLEPLIWSDWCPLRARSA